MSTDGHFDVSKTYWQCPVCKMNFEVSCSQDDTAMTQNRSGWARLSHAASKSCHFLQESGQIIESPLSSFLSLRTEDVFLSYMVKGLKLFGRKEIN